MSGSSGTASEPTGFAQRAIRGSVWTGVQVLVNKFAATGATLALGFLLEPADFGVAGFALSAVTLVSGLQLVAVGDVVLAYPRYFARVGGVVRQIAWVGGAVQATLVLAAGAVFAYVYPDRPWLLGLMAVAAFRPLVEALSVVPLSSLRLNLDYRRISTIDGLTALAGSVAALLLGWFGAGPIAIVAPPIAVVGLRGALYRRVTGVLRFKPVGPRMRRPVLSRALLAGFGSYVAGVLFAQEILLLGAFLPDYSVGLFTFSFGLATQVNGIVSYQIASTLQPIFGHIGENARRQLDGITRACRLLTAILVPTLTVQAALGTSFMHVVWDGKWDNAAPVFVVLSIGQALYVCQWPAAFLLKSQGRFSAYLKMQIANISVAVSCFLLVVAAFRHAGDDWTAKGDAWLQPDAVAPTAVASCGVVLVAVFGPALLHLAGRPLGMRLGLALDIIWRPWLAAGPIALLSAWSAHSIMGTNMLGRAAQAVAIMVLGTIAIGIGVVSSIMLSGSTRADARAVISQVKARICQ